MAPLELHGLSLAAGGITLLDTIDLAVAAGEILALLGPSGAGKTTLLRLVAGLETPDRGRVVFRGRDMTAVPPHRRSFGMMFQEYALFPHRDVAANIAFGLEMRSIAGQRRQELVTQALELVGLPGFEHRAVASLSGGERQRVALARCLAPQPELLLLDEPLASLDLRLRDRLADEIRAILKQLGITALFVTHDQAEAFAVADRIAILRQGRLEQCATPEEIYRHPRSPAVAAFLGFSNLVAAAPDGPGRARTPFGRWSGITPPPDDEAAPVLLIRPEAARLAPPPPVAGILLTGVVERRRFQGRCYQLTLRAGGQRLVFDLPPAPVPPPIGAPIQVELDPAAIVWLATP